MVDKLKARKNWLFILLLMFLNNSSRAQTTQLLTASVVIKEAFALEVKEGNKVDFNFENKDDFENGVVRERATVIAVDATNSWKIQFDSNNRDFFNSANPENNQSLPVGVLSIKESSSNDFIPLTSAGNTLKAAAVRGKNLLYSLDYKVKPDWGTPVDTYTTEIRFTISPQ